MTDAEFSAHLSYNVVLISYELVQSYYSTAHSTICFISESRDAATAATSSDPATVGRITDLIDPAHTLSAHMQAVLEQGVYCDAVFSSGADAAGLTQTSGTVGMLSLQFAHI